ncbi:MAG TPA: hypothetical protein VKB19_10805, partial [Pedobacter sp.]|nr:hypothetical protein [Pedobacter sp.]
MIYNNNIKIAERINRAGLFQTLYHALFGARTFRDSDGNTIRANLMRISGPLYFIFSGTVTDKSGLHYGTLKKQEFLDVLMGMFEDLQPEDMDL